MDLQFSVRSGSGSGILPEKLDKIGGCTESAPPGDFRDIVLGRQQVILCHLQPIADQILVQTFSSLLLDQCT